MMPEQPDSPFCPVRSFEKYPFKLHPICNNLWEKPLESFVENADVWYCNSPVGRDMLAKFMYKLSVSCGLSQSYANHSIRATGATILTECNNFADGSNYVGNEP